MIKLLITARMKTFEHETIFLIRMQTFVMQILDRQTANFQNLILYGNTFINVEHKQHARYIFIYIPGHTMQISHK